MAGFCKTTPKTEPKPFFANYTPLAACVKIGFNSDMSWWHVFIGTFKLKKTDLRKDGFNPSVVKDRLFYLDPKSGGYEELDMKTYTGIVTGQIRIWYQWFVVVNCW